MTQHTFFGRFLKPDMTTSECEQINEATLPSTLDCSICAWGRMLPREEPHLCKGCTKCPMQEARTGWTF